MVLPSKVSPILSLCLSIFCSYMNDFTFVSTELHHVGMGPLMVAIKIISVFHPNSVFHGVFDSPELYVFCKFDKCTVMSRNPAGLWCNSLKGSTHTSVNNLKSWEQ